MGKRVTALEWTNNVILITAVSFWSIYAQM